MQVRCWWVVLAIGLRSFARFALLTISSCRDNVRLATALYLSEETRTWRTIAAFRQGELPDNFHLLKTEDLLASFRNSAPDGRGADPCLISGFSASNCLACSKSLASRVERLHPEALPLQTHLTNLWGLSCLIFFFFLLGSSNLIPSCLNRFSRNLRPPFRAQSLSANLASFGAPQLA